MARHLSARAEASAVVLRAIAEASSVLLPVECAGCGRPDSSLCRGCRAALRPEIGVRELDDGMRVWSALEYHGVARRVVLALKNDHRTDVAGALAELLHTSIRAALHDLAGEGLRGRIGLVRVPSTASAYRRRGYSPVDLVVRRAGLKTTHLLRHRTQPADQIGLDRASRQQNLRGTLVSRTVSDGRPMLLIDDVVTTGATLAEARRALVEAGANVCGAVTIAATPKLISPPLQGL